MLLALAPMQDVSNLAFMRTLVQLGSLPDYLVTEYFRSSPQGRGFSPATLACITENETGVPIYAQLAGADPSSLARDARALLNYPVAGIDLNAGCPAPLVCSKGAGAALLRVLNRFEAALGALREAVPEGQLSVKCRLGWEDNAEWEQLLPIIARHQPDRLAVHARTRAGMYRAPVDARAVARAVREMHCPVIANGNVVDAATAHAWAAAASPAGLMIGRGAIRNPYLFRQLRGGPAPTYRDILYYAEILLEESGRTLHSGKEADHCHRMKKYLVYLAADFPADFGYRMRRAVTRAALLGVLRDHLSSDELFPALPPATAPLFVGVHEWARSGGGSGMLPCTCRNGG